MPAEAHAAGKRGNHASQTGRIADAVLALRHEDLPPQVVALAKKLIADTLLVAAAGTTAAASAQLRTAVPGARGQSRLWFLPDPPVHAADATFVNTLHAAALDYDSLNRAVHADLVSLPAAWSVAEAAGASGRELITAYVAGAELVSRWSRASIGASRGWSGTSLYGGLAAAAASGKLLGLPPQALRHALGLAASQAAGTQQANLEQVLAKRLQPALAARQGVVSAYLAQAGASAPAQALEGRFGLRALAQPGNDDAVLHRLWQDWQFSDTAVKRYPVCACSHAAIEALLALQREFALEPARVTAVVAHVSPFMARLVGGAFSLDNDLQVTAQFSLRYHLASILLRGRLGLAEIDPQALLDPAIASLIPRIDVAIDEANSEELAPARVAVQLASGEWHEAICNHVPGDAAHPLPLDEWHAKLAECGACGQSPLDGAQVRALLARVDVLDQLDDLRHFWDGLHV